jgi:hypothetical protein
MEYSNINQMLKTLELSNSNSNSKHYIENNSNTNSNTNNLTRDLLLKKQNDNNNKNNYQLIDPQRDLIHKPEYKTDYNKKIEEHNFIPKKSFHITQTD